jgi:hypothetical protein
MGLATYRIYSSQRLWQADTVTTVHIMTTDGPGWATLMHGLYLYSSAFEFLKMGYASAMACILFAIIRLPVSRSGTRCQRCLCARHAGPAHGRSLRGRDVCNG